jgi:hypothetical protein
VTLGRFSFAIDHRGLEVTGLLCYSLIKASYCLFRSRPYNKDSPGNFELLERGSIAPYNFFWCPAMLVAYKGVPILIVI